MYKQAVPLRVTKDKSSTKLRWDVTPISDSSSDVTSSEGDSELSVSDSVTSDTGSEEECRRRRRRHKKRKHRSQTRSRSDSRGHGHRWECESGFKHKDRPSTSGKPDKHESTCGETDDLIRSAERSKALMVKPSGKSNPYFSETAINDDQFYQLASRIDRRTRKRIQKGKFVDLEKLLKRSRRTRNKDNQLEILSKDGKSYFLPSSDKESITINSFRHWEQAFHIYAGIFTQVNPSRGHELFQHINNIHEAAVSFLWDNVYEYDTEFRELMSRNPQHNWGVIYHNGRMIKLREHPPKKDVSHISDIGTAVKGKAVKREVCRKLIKINVILANLAGSNINVQSVVNLDTQHQIAIAGTSPKPTARRTSRTIFI